MATMVKEKSREKKKSKDKHKSKKLIEPEEPIEEAEVSIPKTILQETQTVSEESITPKVDTIPTEAPNIVSEETKTSEANISEKCDIKVENINIENKTTLPVDSIKIENLKINENISNRQIENVTVPLAEKEIERAVPSAPVFIENETQQYITIEKVKEKSKIVKKSCLPLEEVIRLFGGTEIAEVRVISEREEAIVEAGPLSKPDHPLIDLLSTFRTSLIAVDRERNRISCRYTEEDKSRLTLWKVEKRTLNLSEKCACGTSVNLRASYDVANLDREKLAAAKLRLQALFQDVQDSYCHHQHTALQTHCEIDAVVSETVKQEKEYIREALALIFNALRFSDGAPGTYAQALQRWASILSTALLDEENYSHLFFVLHNLFRQTRSVQWAGHVLKLQVKDMSSAARLLGLLELLLTRPVLESAQECTEDSEAWEELDDSGEGCAVGEGRLRERDLLALLKALPLRDLIARLTLFSRQDITSQSEEWWGDGSGGHGVLKACCGVRTALHVLQRAQHTHAGYARLITCLRRLAVALLDALAALHEHSRPTYTTDLEKKIVPELEACFAAGVTLLGDEAHKLPATLLSESVVRDYCDTLIAGLHDKTLQISSLSINSSESCGLRTRTITQASLSRPLDRDLARTVLEFLFQTGIHRKPPCKGGCDVTARELLPQLLAVHPHIHTMAFHMLADSNQTEADSTILEPLFLKHWRPTPTEIVGVLDDWAIRCPQLLQHLLLNLDYTPHTGVSLDSQQSIGEWVCGWAERRGSEPEWAWRVLRTLRLHRAHWRLPLHAPPHPAPSRPLRVGFALLAGDWGHSVPLACGPGADALLQLAQCRPLDALHCAGLVMRVMAQAPESISLTPKFTEIFATILNSGPSLVQRALGQRGSSGPELLMKLVLEQLQDPDIPQSERSALLSAWLHALWKPVLPASARNVLDMALRVTRDWRALDTHAAGLMQEENAKDYIVDAVRNVSTAPLLCESLLRNAHACELSTLMYARLLDELARQRAAAQRIHVDNALKQIGSSMCDSELSIHRCACAVLSARSQHPAHALLWRLLLHMWLQRRSETAPPVGPLFFSGIVKSRTLGQLKKRLQETALYHRSQIDVLKANNTGTSSAVTPNKVATSNSTTDNSLFQTLSILADLTGESNDSEVPSEEEKTENMNESETKEGRDVSNLISYHSGAEKMVREYLLWLEEGEGVRAYPHHVDIGRFLSEQALDAAWRASLDTPPPDPPPALPPQPSLPSVHLTHFERAMAAVMSIEDNLRKRFIIPAPPITISDSVLKDPFLLLEMIEKYIDELKKLNEQWKSDVSRVATLDSQLWSLVEGLRVRRPLPPVRGACPQRCEPLVVHVAEDEWCISTGAEQALRENRRSARAALRRLSRPRAYAARVTSVLHSMARHVTSATSAERVADLAWRAAPQAEAYAPARDTLSALVTDLVQRWFEHDSALACKLLRRWSGGSVVQQQLCSALVRPARLLPARWPQLYSAVLALPLPPHAVFSYLSRFDMSHWANVVDTAARNEVLESLVKAAMRIGPKPEDQDLVLLELLGVHSAAAVRSSEVCAHVLRCARACVACSLPPPYIAHVSRLARAACDLHLDQIGRLLHDLGLIWWEARSSSKNRTLYAAYAPHFADTLYSLLKEYVAAAVRATYAPERVAYCSWSVLEVSWSPWVAPHSTVSLLAPTGDEYGNMITRFVDAIHMIMEDCPGSSEAVLRLVWQWAARATLCEARADNALLSRLATLPWTISWLQADCVPVALQLCGILDQETRSWFGEYLRHVTSECWLSGAPDEQLAPLLATLLALFTAALPVVPAETLEGACQLPWYRLPVPALDAALARYFADHHNPSVPYHQLPHFKVILVASGLVLHEPDGGACAHKRALCISQWVRAISAPTLATHVPLHTRHLLNTVTDLAPFIDPDELAQLLQRALVVLCVQPADALALPVWEQCIRSCGRDARRAYAAAVASLTTLNCFATLADAVAQATMNETEPADWSAVYTHWPTGACSTWRAHTLVPRLHAAYAALLAHAHTGEDMRHVFQTLMAADIDFVQNEVIISVWICGASRAALVPSCTEAARALLASWAERRRTLLQLVTLQSASSCPTALHQLLCRLALCIISPSESATRSYETARSACAAAADTMFSTRELRTSTLPLLAMRLYPGREHYFAHELQLVPDTDTNSKIQD